MRCFARLPLPGGGTWHCPGKIERENTLTGRVIFRTVDGTLHILNRSQVVA